MTEDPEEGRAGGQSTAERLRLFVAISVPRDRLDHVAEVVEPLKPRFPRARWTERANQHVTLKFLGWAGVDLLAPIASACARVASSHSPAELALGELGAFPTRKRVRVLWVGVEDPTGLLPAVAGDLDRALEPLGFEVETRAFTAHLTLARLKTPARPAGGWPDAALERMPWTCDRLTLWRSHLSPKGPRYEALRSCPLGVDADS